MRVARSAQAGGQGVLLVLAQAKLLDAAGEPDKAAALLAFSAERAPDQAALAVAASQAALEQGRLDDAQRWAAAAQARAPGAPATLLQRTIVQLATGQADQALATAQRGLALWPDNQQFWSWAATAARASF